MCIRRQIEMAVFCPLCDQISFASLDALRCSLIKVANEPLPCPVCHKLCLGLDKLTIHLFSHANISHIRAIGAIEAERKDGDRKTVNTAPGVKATDTEALQEATHSTSLSNAEALCHSKGYLEQTATADVSNEISQLSPRLLEANFKCHLCSKAFALKASLRVHLNVSHSISLSDDFSLHPSLRPEPLKFRNHEEFRNNDNTEVESNTPGKPTTQLDLHQQQKEQPLLIAKDLQEQQLSANRSVPIMDDFSSQFNSTRSSSINGLNSDHMKLWECDVCTKSFTTKYFLKKHKRLHTGEMPYTCEICGRMFTFQQSYHKHLLYHSAEKPHTCTTCGRSFKEISTLHNHERIHSGEKPFQCDTCGKSFRQRVSCLVHKRIHTGVMPYKCDHCQKSFRYKVSQRTHKCLAFSKDDSVGIQAETLGQLTDNFIKSLLEGANVDAVADQIPSIQIKTDALLSNTKDDTGTLELRAHGSNMNDMIGNSYQKPTSTVDSSYLPSDDNYITSLGRHPSTDNGDGCISPSTAQRLQDMRIYSPYPLDLAAEFDRFLYQQGEVNDYGLGSRLL